MKNVACEQALLFGQLKRVHSRKAHFTYSNRRACSQAMKNDVNMLNICLTECALKK